AEKEREREGRLRLQRWWCSDGGLVSVPVARAPTVPCSSVSYLMFECSHVIQQWCASSI
ncbi:hypothetical protein C0J52_14359, partial [Blattella germanica]